MGTTITKARNYKNEIMKTDGGGNGIDGTGGNGGAGSDGGDDRD